MKNKKTNEKLSKYMFSLFSIALIFLLVGGGSQGPVAGLYDDRRGHIGGGDPGSPSLPIDPIPARPDLIITDYSITEFDVFYLIEAEVTNIGQSTAGPSAARISVTRTSGTGNFEHINVLQFFEIEAGETAQFATGLYPRSHYAGGTYNVEFEVDVYEDVVEMREDNNYLMVEDHLFE